MKYIFSILVLTCSFAASNAQEVITEIHPEGLKVGDKAPDFSGFSNKGENIHLSELLKKGKVVLFFYRGAWCPYCYRQMGELQDSLQLILDKNVNVLAVTPEISESIKKMVGKSGATFSIIHDEEYKIMRNYNTAFKLDEVTIKRYKNKKLGLEEANGNDDYILPVPATYIIEEDGRISFVFFDANYKNRVTVRELLRHL